MPKTSLRQPPDAVLARALAAKLGAATTVSGTVYFESGDLR